jgi:hypothetical protein
MRWLHLAEVLELHRQLIQRSGGTSQLVNRLLLAVPCFWILAGAGLLAVQGI